MTIVLQNCSIPSERARHAVLLSEVRGLGGNPALFAGRGLLLARRRPLVTCR